MQNINIFWLFGCLVLDGVQGLSFHGYYSDQMVLQRDAPVSVWGYGTLIGDEEAALYCQEKIHNQIVLEYVDENIWSVQLPAQEAGSVCDLEVTSQEGVLILSQIIFGDVWLCSGQSNMEMTMENIMNAEEEIAASGDYNIRFATVTKKVLSEVDENANIVLNYGWSDSSQSENLAKMSAVCYLYARSTQDMMLSEGVGVVPFGMVASSWGGTYIEPWSPPEVLDACDAYYECDEDKPQYCNSWLWNGMINPLKRNAVKGFLWYQGESNSGTNRDLYSCTFPTMIDWWRKEFSDNSATKFDAPFGFVQLSTWRDPTQNANGFSVIRWHQTADVAKVPNERMQNVFMASPLDTYDDKQGYPGGIHPRYKQIVGERLAVAGMRVAYGFMQAVYDPYGPFPTGFVTGDKLNLVYNQPITYNNAEISGFYYCTKDSSACDEGGLVTDWIEIGKGKVSQEDAFVITIRLTGDEMSIAYIWRETPVKEYLGLPIYADQGFNLPAVPWKGLLADGKLVI